MPSTDPRSDAATSLEDTARITIAPKHQTFTTANPPGHVGFDVTSTGPSAMEIVALTYDGQAGPMRLPVRAIRSGGVERKDKTLPVEAGVTMLELEFDRTRLPSGLQSYRFLLEARANGAKLSAANVVSFAHRDPIRR